ncbi:MAG TPA: cytochrome c oxidase subunit II [Jatrophihabitans sp.]|jgi:cytochrome c oxidase subunit 2|uniref:aa3-type cytochrome oxidase subunit II n=1 Tax=Jatrophihabitans sp. TaxID=1932789 RepID=UPI002E0AEE84|nr:cytochrome c oxidase subunit II [Jatrophihabitans sp.]
MAALLGFLTLLLSGCSASDWERNLRFGWPTGVTKQATRMRVLYTWSGVTALFLGAIVWGLIFWACIKYRKRNDELPRQTKYNFAVEAVCFTFPFIVIAGLFYRTVIVENYVNHLSKNPDVAVQVDAFKWNWQFEYHTYRANGGAAQTEAYAGLKDPTDTTKPYYLSTVGSQDEIPVLVVPVGKSVQVDEHSYDVLHSFWVPEFLFKRDVIPFGSTDTSRDNRFEFTATSTGRFVGRCAELCGTYHSQMNFEVRVVPTGTFEKYLAALKAIGPDNPSRQRLALAQAGMPALATTTYPFNPDRAARAASQKGSN